jgi:hypothetical protein
MIAYTNTENGSFGITFLVQVSGYAGTYVLAATHCAEAARSILLPYWEEEDDDDVAYAAASDEDRYAWVTPMRATVIPIPAGEPFALGCPYDGKELEWDDVYKTWEGAAHAIKEDRFDASIFERH